MTLWQLGQATRITRKPPGLEDGTSVASVSLMGASQDGHRGVSGTQLTPLQIRKKAGPAGEPVRLKLLASRAQRVGVVCGLSAGS
jgi:hypothetical protein